MDVAAHISIDYWLIWHARFSKTIDNKGFRILQLPQLHDKSPINMNIIKIYSADGIILRNLAHSSGEIETSRA